MQLSQHYWSPFPNCTKIGWRNAWRKVLVQPAIFCAWYGAFYDIIMCYWTTKRSFGKGRQFLPTIWFTKRLYNVLIVNLLLDIFYILLILLRPCINLFLWHSGETEIYVILFKTFHQSQCVYANYLVVGRSIIHYVKNI